MGFFGRDDRTNSKNPAPPPALGRKPAAVSPTGTKTTLIARANRVEGSILGAGDVRIEGQLKGKADSSGQLLIAAHGRVEGKIHARDVVVAGSVTGDIAAAQTIALEATGKVEGNISAPRITIAAGAVIDGQVITKSGGGTSHGGTRSAARQKAPGKPNKNPSQG